MKIHYIKLSNYRQYREADISFSTSKDKNLTILQGNNGAGKSNLLNAITWCLYGEERHIGEEAAGLPMVNEKVYHTLAVGKKITVAVEIGLGEQELEYRITRQATLHKRAQGKADIIESPEPEVMYLAGSSWRKSEQPTYTINSVLPKEISHFFFFDGEQLDQFFEGNSSKRVQTGIIKVSQINLLDQAIKHLDNVQKKIRNDASYISPQINTLNQKIETLEKELAESQARIERSSGQAKGAEDNLAAIRQTLRNSNVEKVRILEEDRVRYETEGEQYGTDLAKLRRKAAAALRQAAPRVYAQGALMQALELIRGQQVKGELPPKVRQPFFQDLLEQGLCVCGRHLKEGSEFRAHVVEHMNAVTTSDEDVQTWIDGRYKLDRIIEEIPDLVGRQRELGKQIRQLEEQIKKGERQLKEIAEKYGGINVQEVELLDQQRHEFERALIESNQKIGRGQVEIERLEKEITTLKTELERALKADKRRQDLLAKVKLSKKAYNVLRDIRQELVSEVREQIEEKTQAYFLNLIWKKDTYQRIEINKKYQVSVINVRGMSSLGTLSAGEQQVLALSFMAALGSVSGFNAPVVIDTPIGRISGEPRNNIADSLPNYLSDAQLILLMTDTEYTTEVAARLKPRIGKQYRLTFMEAEAQTKVVTVD